MINNDDSRLAGENVQLMILDAKRYAEEDKENRKRLKSIEDLENYIYTLRSEIRKDDGKLSSYEKENLEKLIEEHADWIHTNPKAKTEDFVDRKIGLRLLVKRLLNERENRSNKTEL